MASVKPLQQSPRLTLPSLFRKTTACLAESRNEKTLIGCLGRMTFDGGHTFSTGKGNQLHSFRHLPAMLDSNQASNSLKTHGLGKEPSSKSHIDFNTSTTLLSNIHNKATIRYCFIGLWSYAPCEYTWLYWDYFLIIGFDTLFGARSIVYFQCLPCPYFQHRNPRIHLRVHHRTI